MPPYFVMLPHVLIEFLEPLTKPITTSALSLLQFGFRWHYSTAER